MRTYRKIADSIGVSKPRGELSGRTGVIAEYEFLKLEFLEKLEQPVTRANRKSIIPVYVREYNPFVQILLFYFLFLFFFVKILFIKKICKKYLCYVYCVYVSNNKYFNLIYVKYLAINISNMMIR